MSTQAAEPQGSPQACNEPVRETASICCYCGTGCGLRIRSQGQQLIDVIGDTEHPSNRGELCSKGRQLAATVRHDHSRILQAQWRPAKNLPRHSLPLQDACDIAASKLAKAIVMHGPDSVGFHLSGQLLTEDYAVFNKLARALV